MFPSPKTHELLPYKSSLISELQKYSVTAYERELETESMQNVKLKFSFKTEKELWVLVLLFKKAPAFSFQFPFDFQHFLVLEKYTRSEPK